MLMPPSRLLEDRPQFTKEDQISIEKKEKKQAMITKQRQLKRLSTKCKIILESHALRNSRSGTRNPKQLHAVLKPLASRKSR